MANDAEVTRQIGPKVTQRQDVAQAGITDDISDWHSKGLIARTTVSLQREITCFDNCTMTDSYTPIRITRRYWAIVAMHGVERPRLYRRFIGLRTLI